MEFGLKKLRKLTTMKVGYFDCFSGAAGDMIVGACLDAGASEEFLRGQLARLGLDEVELQIKKVNKNGIAATAFLPIVKGHHHQCDHGHHRNLSAIVEIIDNAALSDKVKQQSIDIFRQLARAEAKVHGTVEDKIHFHEVGAADAIIDIVGACTALESLGVEKVYCSPLTVGGGTVKCEHGILPVPAPATAELIKGIETVPANANAQVELLTPTGAAILTTLAEGFGPMPAMRISEIGYGAGQRDIGGMPNVLRLMVGQTGDSDMYGQSDEVCVLEANIDDATAELIGHVSEKLLAQGALDVYCTAVTMKKNRLGTKITVLCPPTETAKMEQIMFRESTTFGIRRGICQRTILPRKHQTVETPYGKIRMKVGYFDGQVTTCSVEFSDCQRAAEEYQVPVKKVVWAALAAYKNE